MALADAIAIAEMRYRVLRYEPTIGWNSIAQSYYEGLEKERLIQRSFDGGINSFGEFLELIQDPAGQSFFVWPTPSSFSPLGHAYLTGFEGYVARVHFSIRREYHGKPAVHMAKSVLRTLFASKREDGTPYIKALIGVTPTRNWLACRFIQKVGFRPLEILPDMCNSGDAILSILKADELI
jgi:hypothetical protein